MPRAVAVANWANGAVNSPLVCPRMRRFAAEAVPTLEHEIEALGRNDQVVPAVAAPAALEAASS